MALKVIGAGLPRTGTTSQKLALEQLGFGPCYHMSEALQHPEHWPLWEAVSAGHEVDWDVLFKDYASTTDTPGCNYYWDLSQHYPDAKVILSVRDPEAWFASTQNTVLSPAVTAMHAARGTKGLTDSVNWGGSDPKLRDRDYMLARYRRHNAEVKATIPADRLLVYDAADGWAPLCEFLGVAVPDAPFPRVNSTDEFNAMIAARAAAQGGT